MQKYDNIIALENYVNIKVTFFLSFCSEKIQQCETEILGRVHTGARVAMTDLHTANAILLQGRH